MPGYNHYPHCLCGWCYKSGTNGYSSVQAAERFFDKYSAERLLAAEGVNRSLTACFVQPNASCPVCDERVFYYANRFGSRVFFDELGWPFSSIARLGFLNAIEATSVNPEEDDLSHFEFTSAKCVPKAEEFFSFEHNLISILDSDSISRKFKAKSVDRTRFLDITDKVSRA